MDAFRFLHAADLHLDSPLSGLEADPDAPAAKIRGATREALTNLVDAALAEQVKFVLIGGDLYDGEWQDWRTGQFLLRQIERLTRHGIRVVAIRGNHDAESVITRRLTWPEGARMLRADRAETEVLPELGTAVHGRSFPQRDVYDEKFVSGYPEPVPGLLNIGLLHTALSGRSGHARYAPCTVEQLAWRGYAYWALGHVHTREVVSREPWIVFPGNLQGRDIGEAGAKGATLVTVRDGGIAEVEHRVLDVVRFAKVGVDVGGAEDEDAAFIRARSAIGGALRAADQRLLAARCVLSGASRAHAALSRSLADTREKLRNAILAAGGGDAVWLERVVVETRPALDVGALCERSDTVGRLAREIVAGSEAELAPMVQDWVERLLERAGLLRSLLGEADPAVLTASGVLPAELIERAKAMLLARLMDA